MPRTTKMITMMIIISIKMVSVLHKKLTITEKC